LIERVEDFGELRRCCLQVIPHVVDCEEVSVLGMSTAENPITKNTRLTVFVLVGRMMPFLSVFLLPEAVVVVVKVETVVVFSKETREAGGAEETPNTPALV
jgi:hypothetical protein